MTRNLRILTAVSLTATAVLSLLWTLLEPDLPADYADRLASLADAGTAAELSGLFFVLAQLPFIVGVVGVAAWLHRSSPRLAVTGGTLGVLGGFGHAVFGGVMLAEVGMAGDATHREAAAALLEDVEALPVLLPFIAAGLLGTVLGLLLLSIALWRSRLEPRWAAPALWAFLVVEFVGSNLSSWAPYLAGPLYIAAFVGIGARIAQRERTPELV